MLRSRIAPTPSGYLHIGNANNFLLTEAIVRKAGGSLRLRLDDLDAARVRPEYVQDVFESLTWLGIEPNEGPKSASEQQKDFSQHNRLPQYNELLQQLVGTGLVFACKCSRKDLQQNNEGGQYTGTCLHKKIPLDTPDVAWRIQTSHEGSVQFHDGIMGYQLLELWKVQRHFIIRRRDGLPAYHVASLSDDIAYGIKAIVRGKDLLTSTGAQLYLAGLLGLKAFSDICFYHHPLLLDAAGEKLSKSAGSTSLKAMRETGMPGSKLREMAADWYKKLL